MRQFKIELGENLKRAGWKTIALHSDKIFEEAETFECVAKGIEPASLSVVTPSYDIGGESLSVATLS